MRLSALFLIFFSNNFVANKVLCLWEMDYIKMSNIPYHDIGIVLGGVTRTSQKIYERPEFTEGADRLLDAVRLYHDGKLGTLLITGGKSSITSNKIPAESLILKEAAMSFGVKEADILIEDQALNTYENAKFSFELLRDHEFTDQKLLLITSSFHMRRAKACFEKQNLVVDTFPTDHLGSQKMSTSASIYPSLEALSNWNLVLHEIFGIIIYRLKGYL